MIDSQYGLKNISEYFKCTQVLSYVLEEVLKYFMSWLYCTCTCTYNMDLCTCDVLKYSKKYLNPCCSVF